MPRRVLTHALLLDPAAGFEQPGGLLLEDGRIRARLAPGDPGPEDAERVDLGGRLLCPGFLDLHLHGDWIFRAPAEIAGSLRRTAEALVRYGTTGFLPTSVAWPAPELRARVEALAAHGDSADGGAEVLGIHLEGPWIRAEAAGAQPGPGIRPYDAAEGSDLLERGGGRIRLVTLAPEVPGADRLQHELARRGVVAALGHSLADAETIQRGVDRGLRHVTHLFNAMGPLHHRDLGVAGVALCEDRLSCDLICDGVHVHPAIVRLAARSKGDGLLLITDRMDPPADAEGSFGAGRVVDDGSALRLADGRLAGSNLTLDRAIRNAVEFGAMTRLEAVSACSLRPARLLGIEHERGSLMPGSRADLVVLDHELEVVETWMAGRRIHPS